MRVIAGTHKGRRLVSPKGDVRPTSGRVKEALFSIIGDRVSGASVADLYAGTGAIGIEALSRGAGRVTFVESNPGSLRILKANLTACGLEQGATVVSQSAEAFLALRTAEGSPYSIIFADPPYRLDAGRDLLPRVAQSAMIGPYTLIILEHPSKQELPSRSGRLARGRQYRYGDTSLSVYRVESEAPPPA